MGALCVFALLLACQNCFGSSTLTLSPMTALDRPVQVSPLLYHDITGDFDLDEIQRASPQGLIGWPGWSADVSVPVNSHDDIWAVYEIVNHSGRPQDLVLFYDYPRINELDIYIFSENTLLNRYEVGTLRPYRQRPLKTLVYTFPLKLQTDQTVTIVMRFTGQLMNFNERLFIQNFDDYVEDYGNTLILFSLLLGCSIVMGFYNIMIYLWTRELSFLLYALYAIAVTLTMAATAGYGHKFLWPDSIWWGDHGLRIIGLTSAVLLALFGTHFLELKRHRPALYRLLQLLCGITCSSILVIILFSVNSPVFMLWIAATTMPMVAILWVDSLLLWKDVGLSAQIFTIAFLVFLLGTFITFLQLFEGPLADYSFAIGNTLQVVLFSIAVSSRINSLREEKTVGPG